MVNSRKALEVQLKALDEEIFKEYQDRYKQDPFSRPRPDVGRLGQLWSHWDFVNWELTQTED